jgi:hypothetical protein
MMSGNAVKPTRSAVDAGSGGTTPGGPELSEDERSKDAFFARIAEMAEEMIARHGKDFAIGSLVLAAKFIAEGKPLVSRSNGGGKATGAGPT